METTIWDKIADTSWWLMAFYCIILYSACLATRPHRITYKAYRFSTLLFIALSIPAMMAGKPISSGQILIWAGSATIGMVIGWLHYQVINIKIYPGSDIIEMPGNWLGFVFLAGLFYAQSHFASSFTLSMDLIHNQHIIKWLPPVYGFISGLMLGKVLNLRSRSKNTALLRSQLG